MTRTPVITRLARALGAPIALAVLALAVPAESRASDCGTDYLICVTSTIVDINSSDALHERDCWGAYVQCVARKIMAY